MVADGDWRECDGALAEAKRLSKALAEAEVARDNALAKAKRLLKEIQMTKHAQAQREAEERDMAATGHSRNEVAGISFKHIDGLVATEQQEEDQLPSWRVLTECSAYNLVCTISAGHVFLPYSLAEPPHTPRQVLWTAKEPGEAMAQRVLFESFATDRSLWWRRTTSSDEAAVEEAARLVQPRFASRRARAALRMKAAPIEDQLRRIVREDLKSKQAVAWTISDFNYATEMIHEVASMARSTAGFGSNFFVVALDEPTLRACAGAGLACVATSLETSMGGGGVPGSALQLVVQSSKFVVSHWLAANGVDFLFFEMDVWFVKNAHRLIVASLLLQEKFDMVVAAHQNNPTATNIGVYAVRASNKTATFFADCIADSRNKTNAHDQLIFHNMLTYHRLERLMMVNPKPWKDKPTTPRPLSPVLAEFLRPHIGVCSTHPVPTDMTIFVHTLGTAPLKEHHGKRIHAKELGVWHGHARPLDLLGHELPAYYGPSAHDGRTKYLALDGRALMALSISEREGYHNVRWLKAHVAVLVAFAKATGRILILPRIIADYHIFFLWTFLDLQSLADLCDWRETNFAANRRSWKSRTMPFSSVVQVSLMQNSIGIYNQSLPVSWYRIAPQENTLKPAEQSWRAWAMAIDRPEELLLVNDAFVDHNFVRILTNCKTAAACYQEGVPRPIHYVYSKLRWCGTGINLDRHVSKSFQGSDCFGLGQSDRVGTVAPRSFRRTLDRRRRR